MEGIKESQLYYTTPQAKKQAGNAGNAKESLTEQPLPSCPEPAGMSLRDDQLQEFRVEA